MTKDWNQAYEDDDTPWDKGSASPSLLEFLAKSAISGRVLVPGCGTGHDVRALAGQGADVIGMDIAPSAIRQAKAFPEVEGARYVINDFLNLGARHTVAYDWVVEHTCLCALEFAKRAAYVESLCCALKPGGQYLAVFFREVSDYTGNGPPHPISREESDALFSDAFEVVESFIPQQTYPSRPVGAEEVCWMRLRK
ncbi:MAG: SAM-dependent methyltransferase [Candidatus Azotimanducaceae bacterium]|jgi:SAM-dependent methyltransferase